MGTTYGTPRTKGRKRIIAIITVAMVIVSILSLTVWAAAEDAYYTTVAEAPGEYVPNAPPSSDAESDDEQDFVQESNEPDSSISDESADRVVGDGAGAESPDDNSSDDHQGDDSSNANESEDEYEYGDEDYEEKLCTCECAYYYDYDCTCECDDCEEYYVDIEIFSDFVVIDWNGLYDVFTNLMTTDGLYTVSVVGSITMSAQLIIPAGRTVYLSGGGVLYQLTVGTRHFSVDGTLVLNSITLRGAGATINHRGGVIVSASGELIMNAGSSIENNFAAWGGGVHNSGTFTMNGGAIRQNIGEDSRVPWNSGGGGVYNNGTFIMTGGEIANNNGDTGGGIISHGYFLLNCGVIRNNGSFGGGGVCIRGGEFIMHNGSIIENHSGTAAGGVRISDGSKFIMNGGEINRNIANGTGAGIFIGNNGTLIMNGGEISGNFAQFIGGGISNGGQIVMNGGSISGNTSYGGRFNMRFSRGGGISNSGTLTMNAGTITGNTAVHGGGVNNNGTFIMTGGTIVGNIAREDDDGIEWYSGVYFIDLGTPSMTGGYIAGNTDVKVMVVNGTQINIAHVPVLERTGYNFVGWLLGEELLTSTEVTEVVINESMTFAAQWVRNPSYWFTVTFSPGTQGTFTEQVFTNILYGTTTPAFVGTPTGNEGWIFSGWSSDVATIVTANTTYVAQWEEIVQTIPEPQYRTIRIYYYLEGYGCLVNDTVNNAIGREYVRRVGSTFCLEHVVDRNELNSDNDYVFEGWRVYLGDVFQPTYLDMNVRQLHGSFDVPEVISKNVLSLCEYALTLSYVPVGETIKLVAVWSIYEALKDGNGDSYHNDDDNNGATPPTDGSNQRKLPATGVESNVVTRVTLLVFTLIVGICTVAKVRNISDKDRAK